MYKCIENLPLFERLHASGWSAAEEELLLENARTARENRRPLNSAFNETAKMTGRKPNSVRNHYYQLAKSNPDLLLRPADKASHFTKEQLENLMREMLIGTSKGESVRGCALRLGGGDLKLMLRYQNKFRSTVQKRKEYVRNIVGNLKKEGCCVKDPYENFKQQRESAAPEKAFKLLTSLSKRELNDLIEKLQTIAVE